MFMKLMEKRELTALGPFEMKILDVLTPMVEAESALLDLPALQKALLAYRSVAANTSVLIDKATTATTNTTHGRGDLGSFVAYDIDIRWSKNAIATTMLTITTQQVLIIQNEVGRQGKVVEQQADSILQLQMALIDQLKQHQQQQHHISEHQQQHHISDHQRQPQQHHSSNIISAM